MTELTLKFGSICCRSVFASNGAAEFLPRKGIPYDAFMLICLVHMLSVADDADGKVMQSHEASLKAQPNDGFILNPDTLQRVEQEL